MSGKDRNDVSWADVVMMRLYSGAVASGTVGRWYKEASKFEARNSATNESASGRGNGQVSTRDELS